MGKGGNSHQRAVQKAAQKRMGMDTGSVDVAKQTTTPGQAPPASKPGLSRFKHWGWGWVLSAISVYFATAAPEVIRVLCLCSSFVVATVTIHQTPFATRRYKYTKPAGIRSPRL